MIKKFFSFALASAMCLTLSSCFFFGSPRVDDMDNIAAQWWTYTSIILTV